MNKIAGYIFGVLLIIIGIIIIISGFAKVLTFGDSISTGQMMVFSSGAIGVLFIFLGGIFIIIGATILYYTSIGKIFSYIAKETAPGVEHLAGAVGRGWKGKKLKSKKVKKTKAKL